MGYIKLHKNEVCKFARYTFGHSEGSSYFYSRGYLKYLMVEYRLFPVFIIKIRICVQIVNTGIFAKLKDKGYLNTAPAVL